MQTRCRFRNTDITSLPPPSRAHHGRWWVIDLDYFISHTFYHICQRSKEGFEIYWIFESYVLLLSTRWLQNTKSMMLIWTTRNDRLNKILQHLKILIWQTKSYTIGNGNYRSGRETWLEKEIVFNLGSLVMGKRRIWWCWGFNENRGYQQWNQTRHRKYALPTSRWRQANGSLLPSIRLQERSNQTNQPSNRKKGMTSSYKIATELLLHMCSHKHISSFHLCQAPAFRIGSIFLYKVSRSWVLDSVTHTLSVTTDGHAKHPLIILIVYHFSECAAQLKRIIKSWIY